MTQRKIIITGARGEIGRALSRAVLARGDALVVISRDPAQARQTLPAATDYLAWTPDQPANWALALDGAYGVVNLAGAPLFGGRKERDYYARVAVPSRRTGIRGLIAAMEQTNARPQVFISGASVGYYGYGPISAAPLTEDATPGTDSYGQNSAKLEAEALRAEALGVRTVIARTGFVLDAQAGGLPGMAQAARRGFGSYTLPANAWRPWVHIADVVGLFLFALDDERVRGPLNVTAPEPVTSRAFAQTLGATVGKAARLPMPGWLIKRFVGEAAGTILTRGRRVIPAHALKLGYAFQYPTLDRALQNLLAPATPPATPRHVQNSRG